MKTTIQILLVLLIAAACRKPGNKNVVTIEGQLMSSCNTPAANKSGFILTNDGLLSGPGISLNFTTDENGFFKITHTGKEDVSSFMLRVQGSSDVLNVTGLPGDNKDLGKVYINPFPTNFVIKLDVQNPYTENDTLVIRDYTSSNIFAAQLIPGPFTSGFLDSVVNYTYFNFPLRYSEIMSFGGPQSGVSFRIRSVPNYVGDNKNVKFNIAPICSGEFAEVTLVID